MSEDKPNVGTLGHIDNISTTSQPMADWLTKVYGGEPKDYLEIEPMNRKQRRKNNALRRKGRLK